MKQIFSMSRWLLLLRLHWSENKRKYILSLVAIAALLLAWFGLLLTISSDRKTIDGDMQVRTYYVGLFLAGCMYASLIFSDLSNHSRGIHYLTLPASVFEKFLSVIFFGIILFFITYTAVFYMVDISIVKLSNSLYLQHIIKNGSPLTGVIEIANVFVLPQTDDYKGANDYYSVLTTYFLIQSAFVLGSVYFRRYSFLLTITSLLVVGALIILLIARVYLTILPAGDYEKGFSAFFLRDKGSEVKQMIILPAWLSSTSMFAFRYLLLVSLLTAAYFRLKEKQI